MIFFLFLLLGSLGAQAKTFSNSYVSFDLPEGWNCLLQATEWVCRHGEDKTAKEAIIIFTAKEAGSTDSLEQYARHLRTPQTHGAKSSTPSKVIKEPAQVMIMNYPWIEGLHQDAEIKNYITRYLATVSEGVAVGFSFTAHKEVYDHYHPLFFKAAQTLKITAKRAKDLPSSNGGGGNIAPLPMPPGEEVATPIPRISELQTSSKMKAIMFLLAVVTGAAALVLLLRNKK